MKSESIYVNTMIFLPDKFPYISEVFYQNNFRYLGENLENVISTNRNVILFLEKGNEVSCMQKQERIDLEFVKK